MKVFLDTNIHVYGAPGRVRTHVTKDTAQVVSQSGERRDFELMRMESSFRRPKDATQALQNEVTAIYSLLNHARSGGITLVSSVEVELELLFQPIRQTPENPLIQSLITTIPSPQPLQSKKILPFTPDDWRRITEERWDPMFGFDSTVDSPEQMSRILYWLLQAYAADRSMTFILNFQTLLAKYRSAKQKTPTAAELLMPAFEEIRSARYRELVEQMHSRYDRGSRHPNQCMDAYLLWTAELGNCDRFLTCDDGILSAYDNRLLEAATPSVLEHTLK